MAQPSLQNIIGKLHDILNHRLTREQVADWAMAFIKNDEVDIKDFNAWELLKQVGAIDIMESPNNYLYSVEDIKQWITEYTD